MRVLGISGSPRENGNTETLVRQALVSFREREWEVAEFFLSSKTVLPCRGCEYCTHTGRCVVADDDMELLLTELQQCDAMIVGSPAYYRNVTAQLKALFDRTYVLRNSNALKGKLGGAISVGRGEGRGQSLVLSIIHNYYLSLCILCVPGELNGLSARADLPGDVMNQPKRLEQARALGENLLRSTLAMKSSVHSVHRDVR